MKSRFILLLSIPLAISCMDENLSYELTSSSSKALAHSASFITMTPGFKKAAILAGAFSAVALVADFAARAQHTELRKQYARHTEGCEVCSFPYSKAALCLSLLGLATESEIIAQYVLASLMVTGIAVATIAAIPLNLYLFFGGDIII